jgi:hypothetical protein
MLLEKGDFWFIHLSRKMDIPSPGIVQLTPLVPTVCLKLHAIVLLSNTILVQLKLRSQIYNLHPTQRIFRVFLDADPRGRLFGTRIRKLLLATQKSAVLAISLHETKIYVEGISLSISQAELLPRKSHLIIRFVGKSSEHFPLSHIRLLSS